MQKIIVITSGKGGVGKTTSAINIGAAVNYFGKDVLIIDGNLSTPNIGIHLGSPQVPISLNDVLSEEADLFDSIYEHESGMKILPSSLSIKDLGKIEIENIKSFKKDFKKISDIIIIDSAAGLGEEVIPVLEISDEIIIVTNPELPAITDALKTIKLAEQMKKKVLGVIVTRVKKDDIEISPNSVKEMLEVEILGMIPEDLAVQKSISLKDAVVHTHPKSNAARAYKEIAARILDEEYDSNKDREKIWNRFLQKVRLQKRY